MSAWIRSGRGSADTLRAWRWVAAGLVGLLAYGIVGVGFFAVYQQHRLDREGVRVDAVVVGRDTSSRYIDVRYQAGARTVTEDVHWSDPLPEAGAPVVVEYDPKNPTWVRRPGDRWDLGYAVGVMTGGGVITVMFALAQWGCSVADRRPVGRRAAVIWPSG